MEEQKLSQEGLQEEMRVEKSETVETRKLLSPCNIDAEDTSHLAVDDLRFALEQADSRNIAITGHYGSGKSSVVNTCIEEMGIKNDVLRISMSTFQLTKEEAKSNGDLYSDDIEYKIVQHLLYKCDKSKIPHSGFKRIKLPEVRDFRNLIVMLLCALACYIIAFEPTVLRIDSFYDAYYKLLGEEVGWWINLIADTGSIAYLIFFLFKACAFLVLELQKFKNIKIVAKGVALEASKNTEVSVFNKYLDEIIYIIQANEYKYILFEDLDRLKNSDKLFLKIREINMLINESEVFKKVNRVVRFIYAIRDDVFTRELRTKCFDYIVAVVPVVDHYNITDYMIKEYQQKGLFKSIETPVLEQLLSRVSGLRELKNIVNEYTLFDRSHRANLSEELENYEQKLLAVIIYKNLYPQDFAKAYLKEGLFYAVFNQKLDFSESLTKELREKVLAAKTSINEAREKIVAARRLLLDTLNNEETIDTLIKDGYDYTLEQVATRDNLFELFVNDDFDEYTYHDHDRESSGKSIYKFRFKEQENKVEGEIGYYEATRADREKYTENLNRMISLEKEIKIIENTAIMDIIGKIGADKTTEVLNELYEQEYPEPTTDREEMIATLQQFLYGGFVSEDYYLYISKFYEGSASGDDYQFYSAILGGAEKPYDQKLNNPKNVVSKFVVNNFKNRNILNYDILNCLLDNKEEHYLPSFIETARSTPDFIVSYYKMSVVVKDEFFTRVFDGWNSCVNVIKEQEKAENTETLLELFFREAPLNIKLTDEEKRYLFGKYEFIHNHIKSMKTEKLKAFVRHHGLCFEMLVRPNKDSQDFYEYCITNKRFSINKNNLSVILGDDFGRKPMTAILGLENDVLKKYLLSDATILTSLFPESCREEEWDGLSHLIEGTDVNRDWLKGYVSRQDFVFEDLTDLSPEGTTLLLSIDKLKATWENVYDAFKILGSALNDVLKEYVIRHVDELASQKCELDEDNCIELQESLMVTGNLPFDVFKQFINCFDLIYVSDDIQQINDEERISLLLENDMMEYDSETLSHISTNYSSRLTTAYFIRYYDDILSDEEVDVKEFITNELCIAVLSSDIPQEKKGQFLLEHADIDVTNADSSKLAEMVLQFYLSNGFDMGVRKDLLLRALEAYLDEHEWFLKIRTINKYNATMTYSLAFEKQLIDTLGGEYLLLNTTYGRAWFDINDENHELLAFLKLKGHYVNNFDKRYYEKEKRDKYFVSFKSIMPKE